MTANFNTHGLVESSIGLHLREVTATIGNKYACLFDVGNVISSNRLLHKSKTNSIILMDNATTYVRWDKEHDWVDVTLHTLFSESSTVGYGFYLYKDFL